MALERDLIERRWLAQEARRLGIDVDQRATTRRGELTYVEDQSRVEQLKAAVRRGLELEDGAITPEVVKRVQARFPQRFATPASREVRLAVAQTRPQAERVARAFERDRGWRRFTKPVPFPLSGGIVFRDGRATVTDNLGDDALMRAVFATSPGRVGDPVRTPYGWAIFIVDGIEPRSPLVAAASPREAVRTLLVMQRERRVARSFVARHRAETTCAPGYVVRHCGASDPDDR